MIKIFIDPGHGGKDPGAVGNGIQEKDIVLDIGLKMRDIFALEYEGVAVEMSRTKDTYPTLTQRVNHANNWGADYFVSIHINAGGGTGFETFIYSGLPANGVTAKAQDIVHAEILNAIGLRDRGKKRGGFQVIKDTKMPAILTENGFIDNVNDANLMKQDSWRLKVARAHVEGIAKAFNIKKKQAPKPQPTNEPCGREILIPSVGALREGVGQILDEWTNQAIHGDKAFAPLWKERYDNRELDVQDAVGLIFEAIRRGLI